MYEVKRGKQSQPRPFTKNETQQKWYCNARSKQTASQTTQMTKEMNTSTCRDRNRRDTEARTGVGDNVSEEEVYDGKDRFYELTCKI